MRTLTRREIATGIAAVGAMFGFPGKKTSADNPAPNPEVNKPGGNYVPAIIHNDVAYVSGQLPRHGEELLYAGKVGRDLDIKAAQEAASLCADLCVSAIADAVGGDDKIVRILQVVGYVASAEGFNQQSQVMNGASDRLIERLGERGRHTRTSVGVFELPRGAPIELSVVAAVRQ